MTYIPTYPAASEVQASAASDIEFQRQVRAMVNELAAHLPTALVSFAEIMLAKQWYSLAFVRMGYWGLGVALPKEGFTSMEGMTGACLDLRQHPMGKFLRLDYMILLNPPKMVRTVAGVDGKVLAGILIGSKTSFAHEFRHMTNLQKGANFRVSFRTPDVIYYNDDQEFDSFYHEALARYLTSNSLPVGRTFDAFLADMRGVLNEMFIRYLNLERSKRLTKRLYLLWAEVNGVGTPPKDRIAEYLDSRPGGILDWLRRKVSGRTEVRRAVQQGRSVK